MTVTLRAPSAAAPNPCAKRSSTSSSKLRAKPQADPAIPNTKSDGTRTTLRPIRSASTPNTGVRTAPGRVNTATRSPTDCGVTSSASAICGNAGVTLATPKTAMRVTPKTTRRFGSASSLQ